MNNLLDPIAEWLLSLDTDSMDHLISLAAHFHSDENIYINTGTDLGSSLFFEYLKGNTLAKREIVSRTLFTIKLIDFALSGKDTEEGWTEFFDRMLAMRSMALERAMDISLYDKKLNSFQDDKEKWLSIAHSWLLLKSDTLSDKNIMNWYALAERP